MTQELLSPLLFQIPTIIIAGIALTYSILSYRQSHKMNNENILYQEKIQAYKYIMYALSDLLNTMGLYFDITCDKLEQKNINKEDKSELRDLIYEIDDKINEFDNCIKSNSSILPNKIVSKLEDLAYDLFDVEPLIGDVQKNDLQNYDKSLDTFFDQAEKLVGMFRKDLNTKELNQGLFRRIKR